MRFIAATVTDYRDFRRLHCRAEWFDTAASYPIDGPVLTPVTIPEGADLEVRYVRGSPSYEPGYSGPTEGTYTAEPKNDRTYAVTIWPGWLTLDALGQPICHVCYAAHRQRGDDVRVDGPFHNGPVGRLCAECHRPIATIEESRARFFAKKRPAHWER